MNLAAPALGGFLELKAALSLRDTCTAALLGHRWWRSAHLTLRHPRAQPARRGSHPRVGPEGVLPRDGPDAADPCKSCPPNPRLGAQGPRRKRAWGPCHPERDTRLRQGEGEEGPWTRALPARGLGDPGVRPSLRSPPPPPRAQHPQPVGRQAPGTPRRGSGGAPGPAAGPSGPGGAQREPAATPPLGGGAASRGPGPRTAAAAAAAQRAAGRASGPARGPPAPPALPRPLT